MSRMDVESFSIQVGDTPRSSRGSGGWSVSRDDQKLRRFWNAKHVMIGWCEFYIYIYIYV